MEECALISTNGVTLQYGKRILFEDVTIKFTPGNCYGLIGANGAGKSTFLKILSGEIEPNKGNVILPKGARIAVLKQDQFAYDDKKVLETVIMGHQELYEVMQAKEEMYAKSEFSDEDGMRIAELESKFAELNGWEADSEASTLLNGLGINDDLQDKYMRELTGGEKVKVLLAQAIFGNPDVLLLDEPTNNLDLQSTMWLENFLASFENTVIVVSHDRHFLNQVCTNIADIDFNKIQLYMGNYDFWYESSQLALTQAQNANKKSEAKIKELQEFIQRFSANASKSKQATSRKKTLEKITIEDIKPSSRKYPYIKFQQSREAGDDILTVEDLTVTIDGEKVLDNFNLKLTRGDKVALIGESAIPATTLLKVLNGEIEPDSGSVTWGVTTSHELIPKDNSEYFDGCSLSLVDWLRQFSEDKTESFIRGFFGRMLFSGEETLKKVSVLSGGERARCMIAKMMLTESNVLMFDDPTNHLDLESITTLNNAMMDFKGTVLFTSHDHQLLQTIANRVIDFAPTGVVDSSMTFDEYTNSN